MGLVSQVFDESTLASLQGPPRRRPRALLHHRREHLAQRAADVPAHRDRLDRAGPQRQPDQHPRARRAGRRPRRRRSASSTCRRQRAGRRPTTPAWSPRCWRTTPTCSLEENAAEVLPELRGAFSLRLDGREHPVRRPRPAGHPAAGARPARARLGGRLGDRGARHRRRLLHPRGRARRDGRRSTRTACAAAASPRPPPSTACSSSSTSPAPTP